MHLTEEQKNHYATEGYLVVEDVLTPDAISRYLKRAREIALGDIPPGGEKMVVRDVRVAKGKVTVDDPELGLWKLIQPDRRDKVFEPYPSDPRLLDIVEDLIGPDIKAFLTMLIYKPPGLDSSHPYHQDAAYFNFEPHDLCMGSWIALDPVDADNGTLTVVPRSHQLGIIPHELQTGEDVNFGLFEAQGYGAGHPGEVSLTLPPGAGVFFHSRLLHRTGPNTTTRHRRVLTVHFASCTCVPTGELLGQMSMRLVRGHEYAGCI